MYEKAPCNFKSTMNLRSQTLKAYFHPKASKRKESEQIKSSYPFPPNFPLKHCGTIPYFFQKEIRGLLCQHRSTPLTIKIQINETKNSRSMNIYFMHCEVYQKFVFICILICFNYFVTGAGEQLCLVNAFEAGATKQLHSWMFPS